MLRVDDAPLDLLGLDQNVHFAAQFFLTPRVGPEDEAPYSVIRRRCIDRVWIEEITIVNHRRATSPVRVELDESLVLEYQREAFQRSITIASSRPAQISRRGLAFDLVLERGEEWTAALSITPHAAQQGTTFAARAVRGSFDDVRRTKARELEQWLAHTPALEAQDPALACTYRARLTDLAALRLQPDLDQPATLPGDEQLAERLIAGDQPTSTHRTRGLTIHSRRSRTLLTNHCRDSRPPRPSRSRPDPRPTDRQTRPSCRTSLSSRGPARYLHKSASSEPSGSNSTMPPVRETRAHAIGLPLR